MLAQIQQEMDRLSPAEQRVARWVLAHPRQVIGATLATVAEHCRTSEPTVIRFCRRFGLSGYRELIVRLTESLSRPASYVHRDVDASDATADAVMKVLDTSIQSIMDMRHGLSAMPIDAAVEAMRKAQQIVFVGLGASGCVARDAQHKFFRLGIACTALIDTPSIVQFAAIADESVTLVFISHSGEWHELAKAAIAARDRGARVITITNPDSSLAATTDILLPCNPDEDTSVYTPMSSRLAQLALLDALQVALALQLGASSSENLRLTKRALRETLSS